MGTLFLFFSCGLFSSELMVEGLSTSSSRVVCGLGVVVGTKLWVLWLTGWGKLLKKDDLMTDSVFSDRPIGRTVVRFCCRKDAKAGVVRKLNWGGGGVVRASNRGVEGEGKLLNDGWNCCKGMAVKPVDGVLKGGRVEGWGL